MTDRYVPAEFEAKWQAKWAEADLFKTREVAGAPKFYGLDFFPYPSGAGLSVGHCRNYIPTDVLCRLKAMQGFNVLHPMGFDAFGLPAENEAIKTHSHPRPMIDRYAATYRRQMDLVGIGYDWSRSFKSSDPSFYRWTQWIFELLYKRGLAYRKLAAVNWDPVDKTVLADEEIVGGRAERSGALVEKRYIPQWFFRITDYAQRLIDDLDDIDWPEGIKSQQRNWIGRSEGVQFKLLVIGNSGDSDDVGTAGESGDFLVVARARKLSFEVFTTRVDTVFGMTFCVLAPEHGLLDDILAGVSEANRSAVNAYRDAAQRLSDTDRLATTREKTGVFTGAYATNPANGRPVPIWVADYVLATYGTGAIMAVPGHDERDFEFAQKFGLDIKPVIAPAAGVEPELPFVAKDGVLINSAEYSGMSVVGAQAALGQWMEGLGIGERKVQYKLRDWLISRQRYWGCPIPVIHGADGELQLVPENCLPVELPDVDDYGPGDDGSSPLAHIADFVNTTDLDGRLGKRETDTMGGFACSSWYFLRFCDPFNFGEAWDQEAVKYWMPVDCYVGGAEHAVMHLLYARFWTKVLFDAGLCPVKEPFARLQNQGQVLAHTAYRKPREGEALGLGEDGILISFKEAAELPPDDVTYRWARMSKSKGNVVTPEEAVERFGADALRVYELFVAPFDADVQWSNEGMQGAVRFLSRVFKLSSELAPHYVADWRAVLPFEELDGDAAALRRELHKTIRKCGEDIEKFAFNTYISTLMKFVNTVTEVQKRMSTDDRATVLCFSEAIESLVLLLAPAAPHCADELWLGLGRDGFTYNASWPAYDPKLAVDATDVIACQVNGKLRDTIEMATGASNNELEVAAKANAKVQAHLEGKTIHKVIVVAGRLVNFVAT
ncbi:MAG: leucine--tRNA ligase [Fimbriimonadaceae bacterium]